MEVFVRDMGSSTILPIAVPATASVAQLKALIYASQRKIHVEHQRLSFGDCILEDGRSLSDYNISHESTVILRYGPKFPFTLRAPPISSADDFELPADNAECCASVSTALGGSQSINEKPFRPSDRTFLTHRCFLPSSPYAPVVLRLSETCDVPCITFIRSCRTRPSKTCVISQ